MSLTSVIRYVQALDTTATDGSGKTGLVFGGITAKYLTQGGVLTSLTPETITTLGTYQAPSDAAHIRIKELAGSDPTKGIYEVHFHDTQVVSTGVKLWLFLSAAGARFQPLEMDLETLVDCANSASTAAALFTTQLTESYAANGAAPTPAQALFLIQQILTDFAISGTTLTIKKKDHSTTAATLTLDSATAPTSATRAT